MNQPVATRTLLHLSVTGEDRRLDVGVPAQVPLVELLPGIVRGLGVLDPSLVHGGFALRRADGTELDPASTCAAQGVRDGELLTLVRGGLVAERRRYDDVVEAVIDATRDQRAPWSPVDRARTALAVSLTLLALGAGLLIVAERGLALPALLAFGGALVLLTTGAVLTRLDQVEAGNGLGLAAAVYGGIGAYLVTPGQAWQWPLAAAGLGLVVVGGAALATSASAQTVHVVPVVTGAALGTTAAVAALTHASTAAPYAVLVALLGALSNALPWLALTSTRIAVISPQSDTEVLAAPPPVDGEDVAQRAARGHTLLVALRIAFAVTVIVVTPPVATGNVAGTLLCALTFLGMMVESRQVYARAEVAALMALGTLGLAVTGTVVAAAGTVGRPTLLVVLLGAAVVLVALTMLGSGARIRLLRVLDALELACLAALLPLGALAAGLA